MFNWKFDIEYVAMPKPTLRYRDHALPFDPHITSNHVEVEAVVDVILKMIVERRKAVGRRINDLLAVRLHVKTIVLNVFVSNLSAPYVYRAVSRSAEHYSKPANRYLNVRLSRDHMAQVMDEMEQFGFLEIIRAIHFPEQGKSFVTRIRAIEALITLLHDFGVSINMVSDTNELIVLRDKDDEGKKIGIEPAPVGRTS